MKDAMTGLIRAVVIIFAFLLVLNFLKPMMMGNQQSSLDDVYDDGTGYGSDIDDEKEEKTSLNVRFDNEYDYKSLYELYKYDSVLEVFGEEFKSYYYEDKKLDNIYYLYLSIVNLTKNKFVLLCNNKIEISEETVLAKVRQLFGNIDFKHTSYISLDKNLVITYDENNKKYIVENKRCSGIKKGSSYIETKLLGGVTQENKIIIYEQAHLVKYVESNGLIKTENYRGIKESSGLASSSNDYYVYRYYFDKDDDAVTLDRIVSNG